MFEFLIKIEDSIKRRMKKPARGKEKSREMKNPAGF
jgi:hypothetical protein